MFAEYVLETPRLWLRRWRECDTADFIRLNADECVMRFFLKKLSAAESVEFLERIKAELSERGYGLFAVERKSDRVFMGFVGLHCYSFDVWFAPGVEISWRLLPEFWGQGYATEAARICLDYGRDEWRLDEIYSFTSLPNQASQRVMQKAGMKCVGVFDHPLVEQGHPLRTHVLYKSWIDCGK